MDNPAGETARISAKRFAARMFNQVNALLALGLEEHIDQVLAILDQIEPKRRDTRRFITAAVPTFAQCGGAAFDRG